MQGFKAVFNKNNTFNYWIWGINEIMQCQVISRRNTNSFLGILVIVNYVSIIVYFPSVVITYHFYWKKSASCCNPQKSLKEYKEDAPEDNMTRLFKLVVNWLETSYANYIVMHRKIRWLVLAVFLGFSITCCVFATKLGPDEDQVRS